MALAGTQLLEKVLQTASEDPAVQEAYLHVQVPVKESTAFLQPWTPVSNPPVDLTREDLSAQWA